MGIFDFLGKKNNSKKNFTPEDIIAFAKDLENRNKTHWSSDDNGVARDFPQLKENALLDFIDDPENWEIAFAINLTEAQRMQIMKTGKTNVEVGMMSLNIGMIPLPIILFRLNGDKKLSFACIASYDMLNDNPELHGLNYFDIFLSQEKIKLYVMFEGERGIILQVTNRLKLSPLSFQVKVTANQTISELNNSNGNTHNVFFAKQDLRNMILRRNLGENKTMGEILWDKYESGE